MYQIKTRGVNQREMERGMQISGDSEVARWIYWKWIVPLLVGSYEIPCWWWGTVGEMQIQSTVRKDCSQHRDEKERDACCAWTEQASQKGRIVTNCSWAVWVARNKRQFPRPDENLPAEQEDRTCMVWWSPHKPDSQSPRAVSGDIYLVHTQNGGWVPPSTAVQDISLWVGRGLMTKREYIGEPDRFQSQGGNLTIRNPGKCGSGDRSREYVTNEPVS